MIFHAIFTINKILGRLLTLGQHNTKFIFKDQKTTEPRWPFVCHHYYILINQLQDDLARSHSIICLFDFCQKKRYKYHGIPLNFFQIKYTILHKYFPYTSSTISYSTRYLQTLLQSTFNLASNISYHIQTFSLFSTLNLYESFFISQGWFTIIVIVDCT